MFLPIASLNTDYRRNIYLAGLAPHFEEIHHKVVAAISSGTVRVGDHPDFLAPVLCDELGGHQDFPHASIANDLTYKQRSRRATIRENAPVIMAESLMTESLILAHQIK